MTEVSTLWLVWMSLFANIHAILSGNEISDHSMPLRCQRESTGLARHPTDVQKLPPLAAKAGDIASYNA